MTSQNENLAKRYSELSNDELCQLYLNSNSLTEEANEILKEEFAIRNLDMPLEAEIQTFESQNETTKKIKKCQSGVLFLFFYFYFFFGKMGMDYYWSYSCLQLLHIIILRKLSSLQKRGITGRR